MENKPLILYTGNFRFPDGDAAAARVLGIGCSLRDAGYEVVFGGGESKERPEDRTPSGSSVFRGFTYQSLGGLERQDRHGFRRAAQLAARARNRAAWIESHRRKGIAAVLVYCPDIMTWRAVRRSTRKHRIPLIVDVTEWHTGANLPGGTFGLRYLESEICSRLSYPSADAVIAISSYIKEYYQRKGCETLRVPPLVDLKDPKWQSGHWTPSESLRLAYAGSPGNKDMLGEMIRAVVAPQLRAKRLEMHILGLNANEARALAGCELRSEAGKGAEVICHGRLPQNDVPGIIAGMDFTVLLRKNDRNANAGFSTKLVESLSCGVPAIVNATSDIAEFVRHGREGFIVNGESIAAFSAALDEAAGPSPAILAQMRAHAKERAGQSFDYRNYRSQLGSLVERVAKRTTACGD